VSNQEQRMDAFEGRLGQVQSTVDEHGATLESHANNHGETTDRVVQLENTVQEHDARLEAHDNQHEAHRGQIVELGHGMDTIRQDQRIANLQYDLGKVQNKHDGPKENGGNGMGKATIMGGAALAIVVGGAGVLVWLLSKLKKNKDKQNDNKGGSIRGHARDWNTAGPESWPIDY